jgi:hypothetical protein
MKAKPFIAKGCVNIFVKLINECKKVYSNWM